MQVVKSSHLSSLVPLLSPIYTLAAWLAQPRLNKPLVPPANAPLAHQRLTLPFARTGMAHRRQLVSRVSSFKSAAFEARDPSITRLKVVREHDAAVSPSCAGRMTISGRMADVCAELDRMARCETA